MQDIVLHRMGGSLRHRGPDDAGVWRDAAAGIGLAHQRLAILDLSANGHQPMISPRGRYVTVFNGEIYNHREMRRDLESAGLAPAWRGHSDTETLLAGIEAWGIEATLKKCTGMFALALWDREARTLTLARDRLGEKPLYYGWQGRGRQAVFLFGSELKALRAHPAFQAEIDRAALAEFMRYGYIPAPRSIYRGIAKLPPGTWLQVKTGESADPVPRSYWSFLDVVRRGQSHPFRGTEAEAAAALESCLSQAVSRQMLADTPLGAFLSGGIDSSVIVALMQAQSGRPVHTFTIGFDDKRYNEAGHARAVARHLRTDHAEWIVTPEEALAVIPRLPALYDEPFADSSQIPTFLVSQLARRHVTVSLSGDGGDELLGGYNRYTLAPRVQGIPLPIRQAGARLMRLLSPGQWDRLNAILPEFLRVPMAGDKAQKLATILTQGRASDIYQRLISIWSGPETLVIGAPQPPGVEVNWESLKDLDSDEHRMMALDTLGYLPGDILCKLDRAAMGVSLETRAPFLDHSVVEFCWSLPLHLKIRSGQKKWLLRQLAYRHIPQALLDRPKMGFAVPVGPWLRGPLRDWAEDLLRSDRLQQEGYLQPLPIRQKWVEHLSGARNWEYQLWNILMFQSWLADQGPVSVLR